jgi:hypothetical protein
VIHNLVAMVTVIARVCVPRTIRSTVELHLSGSIGTASQPDMQKIRIIGFFYENRLHWQFEIRLLLFYSMHLRLKVSTTPDLKF